MFCCNLELFFVDIYDVVSKKNKLTKFLLNNLLKLSISMSSGNGLSTTNRKIEDGSAYVIA